MSIRKGTLSRTFPVVELWRKNRRMLDYEQYTTVEGDTLQLVADFFGVDSEKHMAELARRKKGTGDRGLTDWQELARHNAPELAQRKVSVTDPTLPLPAGMTLKVPIFRRRLEPQLSIQVELSESGSEGNLCEARLRFPGH